MRFVNISQLREAAFARDHNTCIWPGCWKPAVELMHLHSRGFGGRNSADTLDNVGAGCFDHARISDGEYGSGGAAQYRQAHVELFGTLETPSHLIAFERAEALRATILGPVGPA